MALLLRYCAERVNWRNTGLFGDTLSSSSRVNGFLSSANWSGDQPPRLNTHLPGPEALALARIISSACLRVVDAVESQLERPVGAFLLEVRVVVDHPGDDRASAQIDAASVRPRHLRDVLIGADRNDAVPANRHRLRDREGVIDGDDLSVRQDDVGGASAAASSGRRHPPSNHSYQERMYIARFIVGSPSLKGSSSPVITDDLRR